MRPSHRILLPSILLTLVACGRTAEDSSRVLANVGGVKITESELGKLVKALISDPAMAQAFITQDDKRAERAALLEQMVATKAIARMAEMEGLVHDGKVKARIESATAQVYYNSLIERRTANLNPSEADLKLTYERLAMEAKLKGQANVPPYAESLKPTLTASWQQQQQQWLVMELQRELQKKVPTTFAEAR